jgi:hypothetical protein
MGLLGLNKNNNEMHNYVMDEAPNKAFYGYSE